MYVVALPYLGCGHINPMMNLCKLLALSDDSLLITFVVTEEWLGFIGSAPTPPNIRFRSIPNVIPSELVREANFAGFIEAMWIPSGSVRSQQHEISLRLQPNSTLDEPESYLSRLCDSSERGEERVNYIPGISSIRLADFPYFSIAKGEAVLGRALEGISSATESQCILFNSFYELENDVIDSLRAKIQISIYHVGPTIPYMTLHEMTAMAMAHGPSQRGPL
ncbi:UDP-glycosyltransferase 87A1 [Cinnamomum micranthum f. kanehirae]|uniref:UDP-glycosyltransferase 87A1 n=1 Tax=Cinnamomum micranthum f. kanehirae TaxID=337451 RepID=A0A3S3PYQ5_9MAGN|nr:UDP-glycosyltransferase 87A1 [Cinnamomum micranthum f. kanehirae]